MTPTDDASALRRILTELAEEAHPVDLSARVAAGRRRLRRRWATTAVLATVALLGAGGFAWQHVSSGVVGSPRLQVGGSSAHTGSTPTTPRPGTLVTCCTGHGIAVTADPSFVIGSSTSASVPTRPAATSTAVDVPETAAQTAGAVTETARPPSATPPEPVPAGHGCSSPWTDESSGQGSPFASSAQREQAATMGAALCGHLGKTKVDRLVEWISMRGLNQVGQGVTYDIQASGPGTAVYLEIFHGPSTVPGTTAPVISWQSGPLRALWPDGTEVLMTKGEYTPANLEIVVDPAFDAFHG